MKYKVTHTKVDKEEIKQSIEAMLHWIDEGKLYKISFTVSTENHEDEVE